ncbi:hypothetical protein AHiyo8_14930 [Arthrobacter sp. Hiyo8]|nr:hypothetical protein AHiyo8_14930 [Arthrobacter sp. Hiyo8]
MAWTAHALTLGRRIRKPRSFTVTCSRTSRRMFGNSALEANTGMPIADILAALPM